MGDGFLLSSAVYGLLFNTIGWRGCLWIGVLPALTVVYVRYFVKEPPVWVENRRIQRTQNREVRMPLLSIFKRGMISNTALACWWMAGGLVTRTIRSTGCSRPTYRKTLASARP
jgi:SHS family lactate transporter-like MFS transporter